MRTKEGYVTCLGAAIGIFMLGAWAARGGEPTALELIKAGNRFVGEQSKDKLLGIHSDKSLAGLTPTVWYVSFYDPDVTSKRADVKFGAGREMSVSRSWRPFGGGGSLEKVMDLTKLKVDSDKALKTATAEPLLAKFTIKATQFWLEKEGNLLVWKLRLWVSKLSKPGTAVKVGDIFISAETGQVIRSDLHLNKAA